MAFIAFDDVRTTPSAFFVEMLQPLYRLYAIPILLNLFTVFL